MAKGQPTVQQAVEDATAACLANPDDKVAASVLWLVDLLDQANGRLEAALSREEARVKGDGVGW